MNSPALPPQRHIDLRERLGLYARLIRLDKPIGTLLLLWPTLWALWIAGAGRPNLAVLAVFVAGTVLMRSAGCAMNDFADRDIDPHVRRTADRPLAAGLIRPKEALAVAALLSLIAFLLVLALNRLAVGLSFVALFLAGSYPFTKRFLALPQAYLGIAFGFGIPMAFAALLDQLPAVCWWMLLANILWTVGYDTEYAMVDRDDDLRLGIRTSAILFGRHDVAAVAFCHGAFIAIMAGIGRAEGLGTGFALALAVAGGLLAWQVWRIRHRERDACFQAFLQNNWVGAGVFAGIVVG